MTCRREFVAGIGLHPCRAFAFYPPGRQYHGQVSGPRNRPGPDKILVQADCSSPDKPLLLFSTYDLCCGLRNLDNTDHAYFSALRYRAWRQKIEARTRTRLPLGEGYESAVPCSHNRPVPQAAEFLTPETDLRQASGMDSLEAA